MSATLELFAPTGLALTVELYPHGSDTIANTGGDSLTEATNRKGLYTATVAETLSGWHTAHVLLSGTVIAAGDVLMVDSETCRVRDHDPKADVAFVSGTAQTAGDLAAILTAIKGAGWTAESLKSIKDAVDAIDPLDATETQAAAAAAIGTGSGLSAIPWNAAWDAEVQSECADAIAAAGLAPGSGARTCVIAVNDGATALESAKVRVTKGAESYVLDTDVSGQCTFNLDDGSWTVAITLAGYTFSGDTLVVDGDEAATYSMTAITFSLTPDGDQVTAWGYVYSPSCVVEPGATIVLEQRTAGARQIYDDAPRTLTADGNGLVTAVVWADGSEYRYRRGTGGEWSELFAPEDDGDEDLPNSYRLPGLLGAS